VGYKYGPFPHHVNTSLPLLIFTAASFSSLDCLGFPCACPAIHQRSPWPILELSIWMLASWWIVVGMAALVAAKTNPRWLPWQLRLLHQSSGALVVHWEVRTNPSLPLLRSMSLWMQVQHISILRHHPMGLYSLFFCACWCPMP
jgi:hypothetical protein